MSNRSHDLVGRFREMPFPANGNTVYALMEEGRRRHHVTGLVEVDVTRARNAIRDYRTRTGRGLSFTAWVVKCIAQAMVEHPATRTFRKGGRRMVLFEDVDAGVIVERTVGGVRMPLPYIIRRADRKTLGEIHDEIRSAQSQELTGRELVLGVGPAPWYAPFFRRLPPFLQRLQFRAIARRPLLAKRIQGTVGITAVGMFGRMTGWALTVGLHTVDFALGSIVKKPGVVDGRIEVREYLDMTVLIDHDLIDGAPAARFVGRLTELMEMRGAPSALFGQEHVGQD